MRLRFKSYPDQIFHPPPFDLCSSEQVPVVLRQVTFDLSTLNPNCLKRSLLLGSLLQAVQFWPIIVSRVILVLIQPIVPQHLLSMPFIRFLTEASMSPTFAAREHTPVIF